jgi:uncharacterized Zn finger protein (UPF0148 family)
MIDATNEIRCKDCGRPLVQIPGHRKKAFCNDACRQRHHRAQKEQQARETAQAALRASTGSYLPQTRAVLEEVMRLQGMELAGRVAAALADEITQIRDTAYAQFAVLQAEHATLQVTVRELHVRLETIQNVDERFRMDSQVRPFGSWLQKHARYYAETHFGQRFLADRRTRLLPPQGSRADYEARLRAAGYQASDLEIFREAWREMLKTQF